MSQLTAKQEKVLTFIRDSAERQGAAPTLRELCLYMGYKSIGSAQDVVAALRKKGFLKPQDSQRARALLVTDLGRDYGRADWDDGDENTLVVPCLGQVPAGNPLEAIGERIGVLRLSRSMIPRKQPKNLYALQAKGLSMVDAGILDGDWLVVESVDEADPGDIVVASLDGESTVKRLVKDRHKGWGLMPENSAFAPIYARDVMFKVIGRVIALQRSLIRNR